MNYNLEPPLEFTSWDYENQMFKPLTKPERDVLDQELRRRYSTLDALTYVPPFLLEFNQTVLARPTVILSRSRIRLRLRRIRTHLPFGAEYIGSGGNTIYSNLCQMKLLKMSVHITYLA